MQVTMKNNPYSGWSANTEVDLDITAEGKQRSIEFSTHKGHKGLMTSCTIWEKSEGSRSTELFGKGYTAPIQWTVCKRVTEKAVKEAHLALQEFIELHIAEAKKFYGVA